MADPDPDDVAALLALPPEEFVAARTARVRALRAEGARVEATALAAVRKPNRLTWAVGEVGRRHPVEVAEVLAAATELAAAQAGGGGARQALRRFRSAVDALAARAPDVDPALDPAAVGLALRTVLADPSARQEWAEGRLLTLPSGGADHPPSPSGGPSPRRRDSGASSEAPRASGSFAGPGSGDGEEAPAPEQEAMVAPAADPAPPEPTPRGPSLAARRRTRAAVERARAQAEQAREILRDADAARDARTAAVADRQAERDEAAAALARAEDALVTATADRDRAREEHAAAVARHERARGQKDAAEAALIALDDEA